MIRLIGVELTRLRWRRAVLVLLAAAFVVPLVIGAGLAWQTRPVSEGDYQRAEQLAAEESALLEADPWFIKEVNRCLDRRTEDDATPTPEVESACRERLLPKAEYFIYRSKLTLIDQKQETGTAVVLLLVVVTMLIGTTFAGADWNSGSMSNQLLFEVRRSRVWLAKALAVLVTTLVTSVIVLTAYWTGLWAVAASRDQAIHDDIVAILAGFSGRGVLLAGAAALGAYAVTMLFRSTVATLGLLFAVAVVGSLLVGVLPLPSPERWMLPSNVLAVLYDGIRYWDQSKCTGATPTVNCGDAVLTTGQASLYLGTLLAASVTASLLVFRRRDVP
ncbi:hypothetical protein [Nocardioides pacificus]